MQIRLIALAASATASCASWSNLWGVQRNDTVDQAAKALGLLDYQEMQDENPGIDIASVEVGVFYRVPYISDLSQPASWSTSGCTRILHLRTAGQVKPINPTSTYKSSLQTLIAASKAATVEPEVSDHPATTASLAGGLTLIRPTRTDSPQSTTYQGNNTGGVRGVYPHPRCHSAVGLWAGDNTQAAAAKKFCNQYEQIVLSSQNDIFADIFQVDKSTHFHYFSVGWTPNCQTLQSQPIKGQGAITCEQIMESNFKNCK